MGCPVWGWGIKWGLLGFGLSSRLSQEVSGTFPMWSHLPGMSCVSSHSGGSLVNFSSFLALWDSEGHCAGTALTSWELLGLGLW